MTNRDELIGRLEIRCFNCFLVMGESKRFAHTCTDMCKQRHEAARALREDQEELELLRTGAVYEKCQELIATIAAHEATIKELQTIRDWVATDHRFPYLQLPPRVIKALDAAKGEPLRNPVHESLAGGDA